MSNNVKIIYKYENLTIGENHKKISNSCIILLIEKIIVHKQSIKILIKASN